MQNFLKEAILFDKVACTAHLQSTKIVVFDTVQKEIIVNCQITMWSSGVQGNCRQPLTIHWTKRVMSTQAIAAAVDPRNCPGPLPTSFMADPPLPT